jgi:hypothetical protein
MSTTTESSKFALDLVDRQGTTPSDWKNRELGLSLVLFSLAEIQAKRVIGLVNLVKRIEDKLLDDATIEDLDPRKLMELYKLSKESLDSSHQYISNTLRTLNWTSLEAQLLSLQADNFRSITNNSTEITNVAKEILSAVSNMTINSKIDL